MIALPGVDLSKVEGVEQLARDLKEALFKHRGSEALDVLVNNSGVSWGAPLETFPEVGWDRVFDVNVKAAFFLSKALVPCLEKAVDSGSSHASIINVGSIAGLGNQPYPTFSYDASKAAIHHLSRHLASALAGRRITSNAIAPGLVPSKMSNQLTVYQSKEDLTEGIPLGRQGSPEDMAALCLYFASRGGEWTTGTVVPVDGGALIRGKVMKKQAKL